MLIKWEAGEKDVLELWNMMNSWVYEGFDKTYKALGVDFDKIYYESETYKIGREIVLSSRIIIFFTGTKIVQYGLILLMRD